MPLPPEHLSTLIFIKTTLIEENYSLSEDSTSHVEERLSLGSCRTSGSVGERGEATDLIDQYTAKMMPGPQTSSILCTRMIDTTQPLCAFGIPLPYSFFSLFPPPEAECLWSQSLLPAACLSDFSVDELVSVSVFHQVDIFIRGGYLWPGNDGPCPRVAEGCLGVWMKWQHP